MYLYETDVIKQMLHANKALSDSNVLKDIISNDVASTFKKNMYYGKEYYKSNNCEIMNRNFEYFTNGRNIQDEWRANNKIPNNFLKTLIDQKTNYSFSKEVTINNCENITNIFDINTKLRKLVKESSKKAVGWLHVYINKNGEFNTRIIPAEEVIAIFDSEFEEELIQIIRYYSIYVIEGNLKKQRYKVEIWDSEKVTYYEEDSNGNYLLDMSVNINPVYHWNVNTYSLGTITESTNHSWGKVPFIPLWNNDERLTDLNPVKSHIDMFDKVISDFGNNLEDIQDSVIKLVNYGGMTDKLDEFLEYLKKYKVLPLDTDGNAEYMTIDIPIEARKEMIDILRNCIFEFGQGVDIQKVGDGNITNVVIRNRYAGLDLKANDFEANCKEFIMQVFWFVNEYLKNNGMKQDDLKKIEITFNRSLIINNQETVDIAQKSKGIISDKTIVSNHPWVVDAEQELQQLEEEKQANMEMYFDKNENIENSNEKMNQESINEESNQEVI